MDPLMDKLSVGMAVQAPLVRYLVAGRTIASVLVLVDELLEQAKAEHLDNGGDPITCLGPGCAHCCGSRVLVTRSELMHVLLAMEARHWRMVEAWDALPTNHPGRRRCPLLDLDTRECSVYERRPVICRCHLVTSDPELCDGRESMALYLVVPYTVMFVLTGGRCNLAPALAKRARRSARRRRSSA